MIIKKASILDLETLSILRKELLLETNRLEKLKTSENNIKIYLTRDYSIYYIAYDKNKAIGYIHGTIDPKPQDNIQAYLQEIYVQKKYRKNKVATNLINKLHDYFKEKNVRPGLTVDSDNKKAITFYEKNDYIISKKQGNIIYMTKRINILLVYPPFCTPAAPPYSITSLASFLKNNLSDNVLILDLNIFYHKKKYLSLYKYFNNLNTFNNIKNLKDTSEYKIKSEEFLSKTKLDYSRNNRQVLENTSVDFLNDSIKEILKFKPDIVALSLVYNSQVFYAKQVIDELMKKGIKVVIGGPSANDKLNCDVKLDNEIKFLEYIQKKNINHNEINFNTIPDFTLYNLKDYFSSDIVYPIRTSYSCYYKKCTFCTHHLNFPYIEIDLKLIKKTVQKNKCKYLFLIDDMIPKKRLLELAKIFKSLNVKWMCQLRPTKELDKETLSILYNSGLKVLLWGIESGSDRILKVINKGTNVKDIKSVLKDSHEVGIKNVAYILFGFPTETREEFWETRDFLEENKEYIDLVSTSVFGLQKGSKIYEKPELFGISEVLLEERTFLNPKITYRVTEGMDQKLTIKMQSRSQKRIYAINKYPRMMNFFREHMLLICD
jgi:radical SAM superfamily enzyme YgiQ (UPF0313 family)/ribosomal protein S18 acetylase RimI-like enzyme